MNEIRDLTKTVPHGRILNCDETGYELIPKGILSWAQTNVDNNVSLSNTSDKSQITVLSTVTCEKTKLPLYFIAKGKTSKVDDSQLGDVGYHWKNHSESGWINDELFQDYLMHLREYFPDDDELHLILDIYKAHLTDNVKAMAKALNIKLHFIPAGMTDLYQPLDRNIFGPFKAIARCLFREHNQLGEPIEISTTDVCKHIICAWEKVSNETIGKAWSIYTSVEGGEEEESEKPKRKSSSYPKSRSARPKPR